jgi:hypothetical protein
MAKKFPYNMTKGELMTIPEEINNAIASKSGIRDSIDSKIYYFVDETIVVGLKKNKIIIEHFEGPSKIFSKSYKFNGLSEKKYCEITEKLDDIFTNNYSELKKMHWQRYED